MTEDELKEEEEGKEVGRGGGGGDGDDVPEEDNIAPTLGVAGQRPIGRHISQNTAYTLNLSERR